MGQELIAHIVKGPAKLRKHRIPVATMAAQKVIDIAKEIAAHLTSDDGDELPNGFRMPEFLADIYENDTTEVAVWAKKDPAKLVADFMEFWAEPCKYGDATWRIDPDDKKQKIVIAGDATWGDTPDGIGYSILQDSLNLGIAKAFGVR